MLIELPVVRPFDRLRPGQGKRPAFTLIELLVVIAIISLLVSILLPSLNRAKDLAKRVVCLTNMKSNGTAISAYTTANNGWYPARFGWSHAYYWPDYPGEKFWDEYVNLGLLVESDFVAGDFSYLGGNFPSGAPAVKVSNLVYCPAGQQKIVDHWSENKEYAVYDSYCYFGPFKYTLGDKLRVSEKLEIEFWDGSGDTVTSTVLMTDYMNASSNGRVYGFWHGEEGINVLFDDCSASWVVDDRVYPYFEDAAADGSYSARWGALNDAWGYLSEGN
jgi:prepilin-type N-terminal cleavage/methylation domain-containing protein